MGKEYMGIPRENIPWYPTIDKSTCTNCGVCHDRCDNGVYEIEPHGDSVKVAKPFNCVVLCESCSRSCPTGAITFPDNAETRLLILELLSGSDSQDI